MIAMVPSLVIVVFVIIAVVVTVGVISVVNDAMVHVDYLDSKGELSELDKYKSLP